MHQVASTIAWKTGCQGMLLKSSPGNTEAISWYSNQGIWLQYVHSEVSVHSAVSWMWPFKNIFSEEGFAAVSSLGEWKNTHAVLTSLHSLAAWSLFSFAASFPLNRTCQVGKNPQRSSGPQRTTQKLNLWTCDGYDQWLHCRSSVFSIIHRIIFSITLASCEVRLTGL